jgi:hypothetical protein
MSTIFEYISGVTVEFTGTQLTNKSYSGYPTKVTIADSVTSIAADTFKDLSLNQFIIGDDSLLQSIGARAFFGTKITTFKFTNALAVIGEYAFANSLVATVDIVAGSNLRTISEHAFENTPLTALDLPTTIVNIGDYSFYNTDLSGSFNIPCSCTSIGAYSFSKTDISSVKIPSSITSIGSHAFYNVSSLTVLQIIGSKLQSIGESAFEGTGLTTLTIPNSLVTIHRRAFYNVALATVTVGELSTLRTIDDYAFYGASALETFNVPKSLITVGDYAFYDTSLNAFPLAATNIKVIGDYAFGNTNVSAITIPISVTSVGGSAFAGIPSLTITFKSSNNTLTVDDLFDSTKLPALFAIYNFLKHGT